MLNSAEKLAISWMRLVKAYQKLFFLELKLAKSSIVPLIVSLCLFAILAIGAWGSLLVFIGYNFYNATQNIFLSLVYLLIFNIIILAIVTGIVVKYYRQICCLKIRKLLKVRASSMTNRRAHE
jgi:hypothetical protein